MAEVMRESKKIINIYGTQVATPFESTQTQVKPVVLNKMHYIIAFGVFFICSVLISFSLWFQLVTAEAERAMNNYEAQNLVLQEQTDLIHTKISNQYNYQIIKKVAQNNEMVIDSSRVRSVGE